MGPLTREHQVNKSELIEKVAEQADLNKASAARAVDAVFDAITQGLRNGETVNLVGFGTFSVGERAARSGRNPRTGETIDIAASRNPRFKAGKGLKDAVN
ncbi:HU family DNA-binding protein [Acidiferrobacter thiooxydans]|uniref:HU family DNA-binding protein n=2 Tax=Pseudomonadota TaxID=1224 RepID=UPI001473443C|nr:HU family DNA-binding protein [Acidiferrobacter thiooxydans]UEN98893.1 HU family DNA-binding protein [Acidiferrobacter thiooxydans]